MRICMNLPKGAAEQIGMSVQVDVPMIHLWENFAAIF